MVFSAPSGFDPPFLGGGNTQFHLHEHTVHGFVAWYLPGPIAAIVATRLVDFVDSLVSVASVVR